MSTLILGGFGPEGSLPLFLLAGFSVGEVVTPPAPEPVTAAPSGAGNWYKTRRKARTIRWSDLAREEREQALREALGAVRTPAAPMPRGEAVDAATAALRAIEQENEELLLLM